MAAQSFTDFESSLFYKGYHVDDRITANVQRTENKPTVPSDWYRAIKTASLIMAVNQDAHLVSREIPLDLLGPEPLTAQVAIVGILNASRARTRAVPRNRSFQSKAGVHISGCSLAEKYFSLTFQAMEQPISQTDTSDDDPLGWVMITDHGKVVAVQKTGGREASVLGLESFTVDGVEYPPGSLYGAALPEGRSLGDYEESVVDVRNVPQLTFSRLTAWALPVAEREREFSILLDKQPSVMLEQGTISDMKFLAQRAVDYTLALAS